MLKEREGGSRSTIALKSKPKGRLQATDEKIKKIFSGKYFFSSPTANSLKPFQERPAPVAGIAVPDARARLRLASALEHLPLSPGGRPSLECFRECRPRGTSTSQTHSVCHRQCGSCCCPDVTQHSVTEPAVYHPYNFHWDSCCRCRRTTPIRRE